MNKGKAVRLAGFVGALGLTTVLVTTAIQGTGAYFTSAVGGNLTGTVGHLQVSSSTLALNFGALNPNEDEDVEVKYRTTTDSTVKNADIWLVFDPNSAAYGRLTGERNTTYGPAGDSYTGGGLGQFGHFQVFDHDGKQIFNSYNLQLEKPEYAMSKFDTTSSISKVWCNVDANGRGGSDYQHVVGLGTDVPECGVPAAILLQADVAPSKTESNATIRFGLTGALSSQDSTNSLNLPFKIVATQSGQYPLIKAGTKYATDKNNVSHVGEVGTNW